MKSSVIRFAFLARGTAPSVSSVSKRYASKGGVEPLTAAPLRFLVIDGYAPAGREDLRNHGATEAGILYKNMLQQVSPFRCETDIIHPADPDFTNPTPADLEKYHGVAWTGSSLTIWQHEDEKVKSQVRLAKTVCEQKIPSFGSCWSVQMAAVALGGICQKSPRGREQGISRKIQLTEIGRSHPMYEGKPSVFDAWGAHDDEVTHLPPSGQILATNRHSIIQATSTMVGFAQFWAVQYHPEYDLREIARLTAARVEKFVRLGFFRTPEEVHEYIGHLETIHADPSRSDLTWRYGIDADVMSEDIRLVEVRNWVKKLVLPYRRECLGL